MSSPRRVEPFTDLPAHLGSQTGEREEAPSPAGLPRIHPAEERAEGSLDPTRVWYRVGWHPGYKAFFVLENDDPGHAVRIVNLRSVRPELQRVRISAAEFSERLEEATPGEVAMIHPLYVEYSRSEHPRVQVQRFLDRTGAARDAAEARLASADYIRLDEVAAFTRLADGWEASLDQARQLPRAAALERAILDLLGTAETIRERVERHNREYVRLRLDRHREFFATVQEKPLTRRQREATVVEEDRHLVVAGAGTGKTSVIAARVAYLIRCKGVAPERILVLAYNASVEAEIRSRLARRGIASVGLSTFHGFGMQVLTEVKGYKPPVSRLATQPGPRRDVIRRALRTLWNEDGGRASLLRFFTEERYSLQWEPSHRTLGEYLCSTRRPRFLTLDGRFRVKSAAEVRIADWLFRNGIDYEYEARYPNLPPSRTNSGYRPDFFLPASGVYVEHFGIDRFGRTAPWVDPENYREGIRWKREIHRTHGTPLVETCHDDRHRLGEVLRSRLSKLGVRLAPRSDEELFDGIMAHHASPFVRLTERFLQSFRENLWTIGRVRTSRGAKSDPLRTECFLRVFEGVLTEYEASLGQTGEIDFAAMIGDATEAIRSGAFQSPFTHVVIDEFQDISHARCGLVQALLAQPGAERKLLAVGDDWQSIYRFSGSDVTIMTRFDDHLGRSWRTLLDHTFRFSDRLAEPSQRFIQKNPDQIEKRLSAAPGSGPAITVLEASEPAGLRSALDAIRMQAAGHSATVLLLSRYNLLSSRESALRVVWRDYPEMTVRPMTIHRAKGTEADYVVVLGLSSAYPGFPSQQADDPLLRMLVADCGEFADAEERRLFYVALTRARKHVYLVAPRETPSRFVTELLSDDAGGWVARSGGAPSIPCAVCETGALVERRHGNEKYWTCTNNPGCDRHVRPCRVCGQSPLLRADGHLRCANATCSHQERMCPRCGGELVVRVSKGERFLGCSEWRRNRPGCFFTEPIPESSGDGSPRRPNEKSRALSDPALSAPAVGLEPTTL